MASDKSYLDFVLGQLPEEDITCRQMMGEYILYYRGKIIGGIYDNRFLVKGNTARPLCIRCAVQLFVRLPKFDAGLLTQVKENWGNMTESWQADDVQRR